MLLSLSGGMGYVIWRVGIQDSWPQEKLGIEPLQERPHL